MPRWSPYIDTDTGAPVVSAGRLVAVSQAMSHVQHAIATEYGTITGSPTFGAGLASLTHVTDGLLRDAERRIDAVLSPMVGDLLDTYTRTVQWDSAGYPEIRVEFSHGGGERESLTWRLEM